MAAKSIVTERELAAFRARHLTPEAVLAKLEQWVHLLLRLAVGVGKSVAAEELLLWPLLHERFNQVIYLAPTWNILNERVARLRAAEGLPPWMVVKARPHEQCGELNQAWEQHERASCTTLAKEVLCRKQCAHYDDGSCVWPDQWINKEGVGLVLAPEQHALLNRSFVPFVMQVTEATRPLVILDEAQLLDAKFELRVTRREVEQFGMALRRARSKQDGLGAPRRLWLKSISGLLATSSELDYQRGRYDFVPWLHRHAFAIQKAGWKAFGRDFRYCGYDLTQLMWSRRDERWVEDDEFVFIARPYLRCHVLLLSASVTADYAGHRLGTSRVASPFEETRFAHTGSRIFNLRDRCGADTHFPANHKRILDSFALLIARNVLEGRTTVVISRKKTKAFCAKYLQERLAGWGLEVTFLAKEGAVLPATPNPRIIPVLHYGILGTNDYSEYESAYCLNSYYVSPNTLNDNLQEFEPETYRVRLGIRSGPDRKRRVVIEKRADGDAARLHLAQLYLNKLEVDPVIQVAGRVRFMTKAREVVFFQMADLGAEVEGCRDVRSLGELREEMGLPDPKDVDRLVEGKSGRRLMQEGLTAAEAADRLGISRETLFRRLRGLESVKTHIRSLYMRFDTLGGPEEGSS